MLKDGIVAKRIETAKPTPGLLLTAGRRLVSHPLGLMRLGNGVLSKIQTHLRLTYLPAMPTSVGIEVTNRCCSTCVLCPVGQGRRSRPLGDMPWDRFVRLVNELAPYVSAASLYNWGEPLMHPRIYEMIRYVKRLGIQAIISSNLHVFRIDDAEELVSTGLDLLGVALHGMSQETYGAYQPRHKLLDVIHKVRALCKAKQKMRSPTPAIRLDFIVCRDNEHELALLREFAKELGEDYLLEQASLNLRFLPFDRDMIPREVSEETLRRERLSVMDRWSPRDPRFLNPVYQKVRDSGGDMPGGASRLFACTSPWQHMFVCWDGDVNLCCGSFEKRHSVGNVFRSSVRHVWNGGALQAARASLRYRPGWRRPAVLCDQCPGMLM